MLRSELVLGENSKNLRDKAVAIIGIGGTGCAVAQLLSRVGIKKLLLVDRDIVDESNLERQFLYEKEDVGKVKVFAAEEKLSKFVDVEARFDDLNYKNIDFKNADLIIDCTDNIDTRLLINDYCKKEKMPWIYTGAIGKIGCVYFNNINGPCFNCFNEDKYGDTCSQVGVLNSTVSLIGSLAVSIAVDYLAYNRIEDKIVWVDFHSNEISKIKVKRNLKCKACNGIYDYLSGKNNKMTKVCASSRFHFYLGRYVNLRELERRLRNINYIKVYDNYILFDDFIIFSNGKVVVRAENEREAKKKYYDVIGI